MSLSALPVFSKFKADTIEEIVSLHLQNQQLLLQKILDTEVEQCDWALLFDQWNELESGFEIDWSAINHLEAVDYNEEFHASYARAETEVSEFYTAIAQEKALYQRLKHLRAQLGTQERLKIRVLDKALEGFELSGIHLEGEARDKMTALMLRSSEVSTEFSTNIMKSTQAWSYHTEDLQELAGIPDNFIKLLRQAAEDSGQSGYLLKLDAPLYIAILTHGKNRDLRERFMRAFSTRASEQFPHEDKIDNTPLVVESLEIRQQKAKLLGRKNYAELSLATKMADSPEQVLSFLNDMYRQIKPQAEREIEAIRLAAQADGVEPMQAWDVGYYSERLKEAQFDFKEEQLRPYFEFESVIDGMFSICGELFDFEVEQSDFKTYNDEVKVYCLKRDDVVLGQLIVDPFSRETKRPGAWMADAVQRQRLTNGELQLPAAYLTCNATAAAKGEPILVSHNDVETLFHEFGHSLHHLLTQIDISNIAGIAGVEWDAVELPSQFLEHWCWQPVALARFAKHYQSGESLPTALIDKALAAKNHHSAMPLLRQIQFAITDLELHMADDPSDPNAMAQAIAKRLAVAPILETSRSLCAFGHLFAGGYAAGYYSYLWAEVLSSDAFSLFEEKGVFNAEAGALFRTQVLERGGSRPAIENFKAFRGREPDLAPLLRHRGVAA